MPQSQSSPLGVGRALSSQSAEHSYSGVFTLRRPPLPLMSANNSRAITRDAAVEQSKSMALNAVLVKLVSPLLSRNLGWIVSHQQCRLCLKLRPSTCCMSLMYNLARRVNQRQPVQLQFTCRLVSMYDVLANVNSIWSSSRANMTAAGISTK